MAGKRKAKRRLKPGNLLILLLPVLLIGGLLYYMNLKNNQKPVQTTPEEVISLCLPEPGMRLPNRTS